MKNYKVLHKAKEMAPDGGVSALCFQTAKSIKKPSSWTLRDDQVTCTRCLAKIEHAYSKNSNPSAHEIFADNKLSSRFFLYQKDESKKGKSLYLQQFLRLLKGAFPEFKEHLDKCITKISVSGMTSNQEQMEKAIFKSLRSFAGTVEEIAEDTNLSAEDVRTTLHRLQKTGRVKSHNHVLSDDEDRIYFEVK